MIRMKDFFQQVSEIVRKAQIQQKEAYSRGEAFNIFPVCGVNHYENTHSSILAELLSPIGSHGQGARFLKCFLRMVLDADFVDNFSFEKAVVQREFDTKNGRIDILISDEIRAVIIENKIYAGDQAEQLKRYDKFAKGAFGPDLYRIIYLSLYGEEASEQSGKGINYIPASYSDTVSLWLESCVKDSYDKPLIRETLIQYRNHLNSLTGKNMDTIKENELVALMMEKPDVVKAVIKAQSAWEKAIIEERLFLPLKEYAQSRDLRFCGAEDFFTKANYVGFCFEVSPGLDITIQSERPGWGNFIYGIIDTRLEKKPVSPLSGFTKCNETWRYGWEYFENSRTWNIDVLTQLAQGDTGLLNYIKQIVDRLHQEIKNKQL